MSDENKSEINIPSDSSKEDKLFEKYKEIQANEHHFNNIELEIRKLASVWLLAALGAIAFIVRGAYIGETGESNLMINPKSLVIIISCMGNLGLFILWQLDQMVYHRLLDAVFLLGLRMEYLHKSLPPIRTLMILYNQKRGVARFQRWFYLIPMSILTLIAIAFSIVIIATSSIKSEFYNNELPFVICSASVIILLVTFLQSINREKYSMFGEAFNDQNFVDYLKEGDYKKILQNH